MRTGEVNAVHAEVSPGSPECPPRSYISVQSWGYWKSCHAHLQTGLKTPLGDARYLPYVVKLGLADYFKVSKVASHALKLILRCVSFYVLILEVNILMNCLARPLMKILAFANNLILDGELKGAHVHALLSNINLC